MEIIKNSLNSNTLIKIQICDSQGFDYVDIFVKPPSITQFTSPGKRLTPITSYCNAHNNIFEGGGGRNKNQFHIMFF